MDDIDNDQSTSITKGELKEIFNNAKKNIDSVSEVAKNYEKSINHDSEKKSNLFSTLCMLAYIDNEFSIDEKNILHSIADSILLPITEKERILKYFEYLNRNKNNNGNNESDMHSQMSLDEAYILLESKRDDSFEDIKKRYRILVKKYHPDMMQGQGLDDDFIALATKKLQKVNFAFERIKKHMKI